MSLLPVVSTVVPQPANKLAAIAPTSKVAKTFFFIFFLKRKTQTRLQNLVIMMYFLIGFTETSFFRFVILFPVLIVIMDQKESNKIMERVA